MEEFLRIVAATLQGAASNTDLTPEELATRAIAIAIEVGSKISEIEDAA